LKKPVKPVDLQNMAKKIPSPGVSRQERLSDEGLKRLEQQLANGAKINTLVLAQWIRRYGDPAKELIKRYDQYSDELDSI
jgi:hypothetical protein